ncbi:MAG: DUF5616 domain-containing protein, partial [Deltaproteobacteria bacterium]|nr:DUF5616 domain-containing protein [Nannocystaceae bacterium]
VASVHGNWREVATTEAALERLAVAIDALGASAVTWLLDRPVSQSARLAESIERLGQSHTPRWTVEVLFHPDKYLRESPDVAATADAGVLDACGAWIDLCGLALGSTAAWVVDLAPEAA